VLLLLNNHESHILFLALFVAVCAKVFVTVERYTILFLFADVLSCYFVVFHSVRFHIPDIMCLHAFVVVANYMLTVIVFFLPLYIANI